MLTIQNVPEKTQSYRNVIFYRNVPKLVQFYKICISTFNPLCNDLLCLGKCIIIHFWRNVTFFFFFKHDEIQKKNSTLLAECNIFSNKLNISPYQIVDVNGQPKKMILLFSFNFNNKCMV